MQQASLPDGLPLDALAVEQDRLSPAEVDVGRGEVIQALVNAAVVVMVDEGRDLRLELAGQVVVLEQDAVPQGPVPALDLALRRWVAWRAPRMCSIFRPPSHRANSSAMWPGPLSESRRGRWRTRTSLQPEESVRLRRPGALIVGPVTLRRQVPV